MSRAFVVAERSWESLAWRQGWVEMWTLGGRDMFAVLSFWCGRRGRKSGRGWFAGIGEGVRGRGIGRLTGVRRMAEWRG